ASGAWSDSIDTSGTQSITETETGVKTYTITCTGDGGSATDSASVTVDPEETDTAFNGFAIDGYISGANIFIDQNFNFKQDDGEYTAVTNTDGSFTIETNDADVFACLKKRPIVADVPVGAVDSTLGGVTEAYQMILPSVEDAGTNTIVISPFTSLFAEAILLSKSNITEELTVVEGCTGKGDSIANSISNRIDELKTSINNNFSITYDELLSNFIENPNEKVNEGAAQNIAKLLPHIQKIDNQVSDYLTNTFNKSIRANVSLSEDALSIIFSESSYEKLPLNFYSIYNTEPNSQGWYRSESINASGAFISNDGILSRADCSENDTSLCNVTNLTLQNIANTSTQFRQNSSFRKNTPVDFADLGIEDGSLYVDAYTASSWRNNSLDWNQSNNRSRECQKQESIRFQTSGSKRDGGTEFTYAAYSQGFEKADCSEVRHYYTPILTAQTFINDAQTSFEARYYIFDVLRSGISKNLPYDFVDNSISINPEPIVKEIANLPRMFKDLDIIRGLFRGDDYILFNYHKDGSMNATFEAGTNPSNDMFFDRVNNINSNERVYGQAARTAFFNRISNDPNFNTNFYGDSAPLNTSILGRIANSYIEVTDYNGTDTINLQVTPTYNYETKTLDYSLVDNLDFNNVMDFIENGINGNPINTKIWFNPDGAISSNVPIVLYLYQGNDAILDQGESYFKISFELSVSSSASGNSNSYISSQEWTLNSNEIINVSYGDGETVISRDIKNADIDKILLTDADSASGDGVLTSLKSYIDQPSNLNIKILKLINSVSDQIGNIKSFFSDGGIYTLKLDLGSGGHSIIGFNRNIVKNITGTFTLKSSPEYAISVNDMIIKEGNSSNLCFNRSSVGNLSATSFDLSFTQTERPGKGGLADDFTLSSTKVEFDNGDTQSCITLNAIKDTHFDWSHDIYLDISNPTNGQPLSRNRVKITILDIYFPNRIDWRRK
ncbi:MAG: hypothetical protein VXA61_09340, partial [Candidatus Neomarinimicrobiota bacterium]